MANPDGLAPTAARARPSRLVDACLFLLCFFVYAWSYEPGIGPNARAHLDQTACIVEYGTLSIDPILGKAMGATCDWSRVPVSLADGRTLNVYYPAKAPGLSLLSVPAYAVTAWIERARGEDPLDPEVFTRNMRVLALVMGAGVGALGAVVFRRLSLAAGAGPEAALLGALAIAIATTYAPYASVLYAHVPTAVLLALAGMLACTGELTGGRAAAAGFLGGVATMVSYQSALVLPGLALAAGARTRSWRSVAAFCLGGLPCAALLAAIHTVCFGAPWRTPYDFQNPFFNNGAASYLDALEGVDWNRAYQVLFAPYRGLFFYAPVLPPAVAAAAIELRTPERRILAGVSLWTLLAFLAVTAVHPTWWGGYCCGPRLLVPGLALLAPFAARAFERWPKTTAALASISLCHALACTLFSTMIPEIVVENPLHVPVEDLRNPLFTIIYPWLARGIVERPNCGLDMGLPVELSLVPFLFGFVVLALCLRWAHAREAAA